VNGLGETWIGKPIGVGRQPGSHVHVPPDALTKASQDPGINVPHGVMPAVAPEAASVVWECADLPSPLQRGPFILLGRFRAVSQPLTVVHYVDVHHQAPSNPKHTQPES
jgi:hypothetical protein